MGMYKFRDVLGPCGVRETGVQDYSGFIQFSTDPSVFTLWKTEKPLTILYTRLIRWKLMVMCVLKKAYTGSGLV
jgi:hypothetical protein